MRGFEYFQCVPDALVLDQSRSAVSALIVATRHRQYVLGDGEMRRRRLVPAMRSLAARRHEIGI